jgi:N-acetyl-alpha-D-muramate 1-phosphate uridylyltransferase
MIPMPDTAMVFAAGLGTRMRPLTNDRPKALVEVAGKAMIDHVLDKLAQVGVQRAVVNVHHFADRLREHLESRSRPHIVISDETDTLLETGGGLMRALPLVGPGPIITMNADPLWRDDGGAGLQSLADNFDPETMDALLLLARHSDAVGFEKAGDFTRDAEGRIARRGAALEAPYIYAGAQILNLETMAGRVEERFSLNRVWDDSLVNKRLYGVVLNNQWLHVGDPVARDEAEAILVGRT